MKGLDWDKGYRDKEMQVVDSRNALTRSIQSDNTVNILCFDRIYDIVTASGDEMAIFHYCYIILERYSARSGLWRN